MIIVNFFYLLLRFQDIFCVTKYFSPKPNMICGSCPAYPNVSGSQNTLLQLVAERADLKNLLPYRN